MGQILSQPVTDKVTSKGSDARRAFGVSSMQGWRVSMEDSHSCELSLNADPKVSYFAVFDGHGGDRMAQFAGENVPTLVKESEHFLKNNKQAMIDGFLHADEQMIAKEDGETDSSGCAATSCMITEADVICANSGDSRTVLCRKGTAKPLSFDHKPENEGERSRIENAGGFVEAGRVNGNLALSRALGDFNFKRNDSLPAEEQIVTAYPDIVEHELDNDDEFVILACDGIWDCMTSQEAVEFIRRLVAAKVPLEEICELVMDECLAPESDMSGIGCDNMTCMVVALFQKDQTMEEWYDMVSKRVEEDGKADKRSLDEIRSQQEKKHNDPKPSQHEDDEPNLNTLGASQLVQQLFGNTDPDEIDPETRSLLQRMGIEVRSSQDDHDHEQDNEDQDNNDNQDQKDSESSKEK